MTFSTESSEGGKCNPDPRIDRRIIEQIEQLDALERRLVAALDVPCELRPKLRAAIRTKVFETTRDARKKLADALHRSSIPDAPRYKWWEW